MCINCWWSSRLCSAYSKTSILRRLSIVQPGVHCLCNDNWEDFSDYLTNTILSLCFLFFFFSSRRRHTRFDCDWSSDVCSSDLYMSAIPAPAPPTILVQLDCGSMTLQPIAVLMQQSISPQMTTS